MFNWNDFMNDFPYTNFSDVNVSWFLNKFKQIFDEWEGLYNQMLSWKTATDEYNATWRAQQEQAFTTWENNFQSAIDAWKVQTETDIGTWETDTIATLEAWKTTFINQYNALRIEVEQIAEDAETAKNSAQASAQSAQASADSASATALALQASLQQINTNTNDISNLKESVTDVEKTLFEYYGKRSESKEVSAQSNAYSQPFLIGQELPVGTLYKIRLDITGEVLPSNVNAMTIYGAHADESLITHTNLTTNVGQDYERTVTGESYFGFRVYRQNGIYGNGTITLTVSLKNEEYEESLTYKVNENTNNIEELFDDVSTLHVEDNNINTQIDLLKDKDREFTSRLNTANNNIEHIEELKINKPLTNPNGNENDVLKSNGDGTTKWEPIETPSQSEINTAVNNYLTQNPQSLVPDNSLGLGKFTNNALSKIVNDYITLEECGAVGDGIIDDSTAINNAISNAIALKKAIKLGDNKTYYSDLSIFFTGGTRDFPLVIYSNTNSTLKVKYGYSELVKIGSYTVFKNITIEPTIHINYDEHFNPENIGDMTGLFIAGSSCYIENVKCKLCYRAFLIANDYERTNITWNICQFNKLIDCNAEDSVIGLDILADGVKTVQDETIKAFSNEHDIIRLKRTHNSNITDTKTIWVNNPTWGYTDTYFVNVKSVRNNEYANNNIRFIDCSFEGAFNGAYIIGSYCMFISPRFDGIYYDDLSNVRHYGKYITFNNAYNNGSNFVIGGFGRGYRGTGANIVKTFEEISENGYNKNVNYILFRDYPFKLQMLGFRDVDKSIYNNVLTTDDVGTVVYDNVTGLPLFWDGTQWKDFTGNVVN